MDSPEGSANDAMTAEIDRRINEVVNVSIRPLQDQMTQLLTALNRLISTDRATPTPLASSVTTPSTADTTIQATSDDRMMAVEGRRKPLPDPPKFTGKRKEYVGYDEDIWYYINACLDHGPQQVMATFYAAGEGDMMMCSINRTKGKEKDTRQCFNCNQISHIAIRYPKPKRAYPSKVKKAKKREVSSDKSPIEELGSSEAEESSGKE
ncbi:pol-like protein [Colletotrichum kahawae]|uniref:Pol-like protein n=1 Tax=Colletotrichum kahawae TaxID=34407 RepID=A0AAD9Y5B9_COLKA|nr:pol-like protein [Colletotrichum kahawae]